VMDQFGCTMDRKWRGWISTIVFWGLFVASIGLCKRYQWLDTAWYIAIVLFLFGVSTYSVIYKFRHYDETNGVSYQGIPRWLQRFFLDEEDHSRSRSPGKLDSK